MRDELEQHLIHNHPKLFADAGRPADQSPMYWGCQCGDGWYHIIKNMSIAIEGYITWWDGQHDREYPPNKLFEIERLDDVEIIED